MTTTAVHTAPDPAAPRVPLDLHDARVRAALLNYFAVQRMVKAAPQFETVECAFAAASEGPMRDLSALSGAEGTEDLEHVWQFVDDVVSLFAQPAEATPH